MYSLTYNSVPNRIDASLIRGKHLMGVIVKALQQVPYKQLMQLSESEKYYMAGFFDGEGSIGLYRKKQKGRVYAVAPRMTISQLDREIPKLFWDHFGGRYYCIDRTSTTRTQNGIAYELRANERCIWNWGAENIATISASLQTLLPYLRGKAPEGKLMMEYIEGVNTLSLDEKCQIADQLAHLKKVEDRPTPNEKVA